MIYEDIYICCRVKSVLEKTYIILILGNKLKQMILI